MSISRDESSKALAIIKKKAAGLFDTYTTIPAFGGWKNGGGKLIAESGYTLFTVQHNPADAVSPELYRKAVELANFIKSSLNQEAVALTFMPVNFELI